VVFGYTQRSRSNYPVIAHVTLAFSSENLLSSTGHSYHPELGPSYCQTHFLHSSTDCPDEPRRVKWASKLHGLSCRKAPLECSKKKERKTKKKNSTKSSHLPCNGRHLCRDHQMSYFNPQVTKYLSKSSPCCPRFSVPLSVKLE